MNPKKILFLVTGLEYGGAEIQVFELSRELRVRGWTVEVVSMLPPGPLLGRFESEGIPVQHLGMRRGVASPGSVARLARIVRRSRPSIVHSHMVHANLLARFARPFFGWVPLVNSGHSTNEGSRWRYYAYRYTDRLCDRFHTVSKRALEAYVQGRFVSRAKLFWLPAVVPIDLPGADASARARVRAELGVDADAFVFTNVGRLHPAKNQAGLLRAFAQVRTRQPARLWLVGEGELREALEVEARVLSVADDVRFLGARSDVADVMRAADTFVLSSRWEGLPVTVLEAAMATLPVVATRVGDLPWLIDRPSLGLLVPAGDDVALGDAMLRMLELPAVERAALGGALRAAVIEQCGTPRIVDGFERVYAELSDRDTVGLVESE